MRQYILAFVTSLALGATAGGASTGCALSGDCDCGETPPLPEAQEPLPISQAFSYDEQVNEAPVPVDLSAGTVEVTGEQVIVRYTDGATEHAVTYDVTGNY